LDLSGYLVVMPGLDLGIHRSERLAMPVGLPGFKTGNDE
jgi:hypothetical protein